MNDDIRLQYLFFVANVPATAFIEKDPKYFLSCMFDILAQGDRFVKLNHAYIARALAKQDKTNIIIDDRYMFISENALLDLLEISEPIEDEDVDKLLELVERT